MIDGFICSDGYAKAIAKASGIDVSTRKKLDYLKKDIESTVNLAKLFKVSDNAQR